MEWEYMHEGDVWLWHCDARPYSLWVSGTNGEIKWTVVGDREYNTRCGRASSPEEAKLLAENALAELPGADEAVAKAARVARAQQEKIASEPREEPICPHCRHEVDLSKIQPGIAGENTCGACGKPFRITPHYLYTTRPIDWVDAAPQA